MMNNFMRLLLLLIFNFLYSLTPNEILELEDSGQIEKKVFNSCAEFETYYERFKIPFYIRYIGAQGIIWQAIHHVRVRPANLLNPKLIKMYNYTWSNDIQNWVTTRVNLFNECDPIDQGRNRNLLFSYLISPTTNESEHIDTDFGRFTFYFQYNKDKHYKYGDGKIFPYEYPESRKKVTTQQHVAY